MSGADDPPSGQQKLGEAIERALQRAIEQLDEAEREEDEGRKKREPQPSEPSRQDAQDAIP